MFWYNEPYINLRIYDKREHFNSVLRSCFLSSVDPSCPATDLKIVCRLEEGVHVALPAQSAVLCSQSEFLLQLLDVGVEQEPVLLLPDVDIDTVQQLLQLLYSGRCNFAKEYDRFKVLRLLSLLRMDKVLQNLQVGQVYKQKDLNLNNNCSGLVEGEVKVEGVVKVDGLNEQERPGGTQELECKVCSAKYDSKKLVEFIIHEKECSKVLVKNYKKVSEKLVGQKVESKKVEEKEGEGEKEKVEAGKEKVSKLTKRCPICLHQIAAAGRGWRYPFYSHLARKHFSSQLVRDYITQDWRCKVCQKDAESFAGPSKRGQLIAHLGGKHRLIEKYINLDENGEMILEGNLGEAKTERTGESEAVPVKRKRSLPIRYQKEAPASPRVSFSNSTPGYIQCRFCDLKFMKNAVLQSHLLSKHFRKDSEEAIATILQRTGGKCPLCPKVSWPNYTNLDWSIFIHFSRKHKIADGLEFNNDVLRQENVDLMLRKFFLENK